MSAFRSSPRLFACLCGLTVLLAGAAHADVKAGRQALLRGQWAEAEREFKGALTAEAGAAQLGLAELYLTTGKYPEAVEAATQASLQPATRASALCVAGEVFRETGKTADALRMFEEALKADAKSLRARVSLGVTQWEAGQPQGEKTLAQVNQEFAAGKLDKTRADQLTYAAIAARYLNAFQDANATFQAAVEKDPNFLPANLEWGDLFLQKYNAQDAAQSYGEVLKINKALPQALVGMARVRIEAAYDVKNATKLADQALQVNPKYVPAFNLKARLALDDEHFAPAEALLKQALEVNPVDLEALSLLAASRYLQEDTAGYEAARQKALKQNPKYADFYFLVGELAVRQHRYTDGVKLNREAVALDPRNANALSALGSNLLRLGLAKEAEGLKVLKQAFDVDPFNVRTLNTLNLYEQVISKEYETVPGATFIYRYNKKERPLLNRYVPALMQTSWDTYVKKYGFKPITPITVELFTERQHYGARTIGLPELGAQGTCFGELITAMSPSSKEASWELVLAHELAHVFHLQLSNNRVARWFTEGLSEYETNIVHPYWKREHAKDIFFALQRGNLWKISELSAAFTRPDRPNGVVIAYQQSSLVIHYLVEKYGFPKIVEALKLYGQGKHDEEIFPAITGKPLEKLDEEFREFLRQRYSYYVKGFLFDEGAYEDLAALKSAAQAKPSDSPAQAALAAGLLAEAPKEALDQARKALTLDGKNALARFVLAEALAKTGDIKAAKAEYEQLLVDGTDGYPIRFALGRIAAMAGEVELAAKHMAEAKKWDPDEADPYALMMQLYEAKDMRDELLKEGEAYLDVNEHDYEAARLLVDRLSLDRKWADLARVAPRVLSITPMEAFVHHQYGIALATQNKPKEAIYELESALLGGVRQPAKLKATLAKQYLAAGDKVKAKALATEVLKEIPQSVDAQEVLKAVK